MGTVFTLTADIKQLASDAIDDLIRELGKPCLLLYPPKMTYCSNCQFDKIGNKSGNIWISGGPIPFPSNTQCPLCSGKGLASQQVTKQITMLCHHNRKEWIPRLPPNVEVADGTIQTKGFISDLEAVLQSREMIVQPDLSSYIKWRYKLASEPIDVSNIVPGRYWSALWSRIGG